MKDMTTNQSHSFTQTYNPTLATTHFVPYFTKNKVLYHTYYLVYSESLHIYLYDNYVYKFIHMRQRIDVPNNEPNSSGTSYVQLRSYCPCRPSYDHLHFYFHRFLLPLLLRLSLNQEFHLLLIQQKKKHQLTHEFDLIQLALLLIHLKKLQGLQQTETIQ